MLNKIISWLKKKYNECFFVGSTDKLPPPLSKEEELNNEGTIYFLCFLAGNKEINKNALFKRDFFKKYIIPAFQLYIGFIQT